MPNDRKEPGDSLTWPAETWNRWARVVNGLLRAETGSGLGQVSSPSGRTISRDPGGFYAKLSGAGPTYTAVEQLRDPATAAWVAGPRSLTSVVEVNGITGLANTIQFIEPSGIPDVWLTQAVKLGAAAASVACSSACTLSRVTYTLTIKYLDTTSTIRTFSLPLPNVSPTGWQTASTNPSTWPNPPSCSVNIRFTMNCLVNSWVIVVAPAAGGAGICTFNPTQADSTCSPLFLHWINSTSANGSIACGSFCSISEVWVTL